MATQEQTSTSSAILTQGGWDTIREALLSATDINELEPVWRYLGDALISGDADLEAEDYHLVVISAGSCELRAAYSNPGAIELEECELCIHNQDIAQLLGDEGRQWVWEEILEFIESAEDVLGTAKLSRDVQNSH